jgi:hypothetical protein
MDRTWTHTPESKDPKGAHAVEFSKTATPNRAPAVPGGTGGCFSRGAHGAEAPRQTVKYSAYLVRAVAARRLGAPRRRERRRYTHRRRACSPGVSNRLLGHSARAHRSPAGSGARAAAASFSLVNVPAVTGRVDPQGPRLANDRRLPGLRGRPLRRRRRSFRATSHMLGIHPPHSHPAVLSRTSRLRPLPRAELRAASRALSDRFAGGVERGARSPQR